MTTQSHAVPADTQSGGIARLGHIYGRFETLAGYLRSPLLLFVRLVWGWQFTITGWGKLHHLARVHGYFASLGVPAPGVMAPAIATLEFAGGLLLIVGLLTRLAGLLLAGNMMTAYLLTERPALATLFSNDPTKFYSADPFTFLMTAVLALVFGAGVFSLDYLIQRSRSSRG